MPEPTWRLGMNEDDTVDEVVMSNAYVHLEDLGDAYMLIVENQDQHIHITVPVHRKRRAFVYEQCGPDRRRYVRNHPDRRWNLTSATAWGTRSATEHQRETLGALQDAQAENAELRAVITELKGMHVERGRPSLIDCTCGPALIPCPTRRILSRIPEHDDKEAPNA